MIGALCIDAYVIILIRAGMIVVNEKLFPKYLVLGSAMMLSIQAFINMAVAVNLIPVTGQPLPLVSRGGTSTLITCAYFGLMLSADRFGIGKKKKEETPESVHDQDLEETETAGDDELPQEILNPSPQPEEVPFEVYQAL